MKNFYQNQILGYLLIILIAFSPLVTLAQEASSTPVEDEVVEVVEETPVVEEVVEEDVVDDIQQEEITEETEDLISDFADQIVEDLVEPIIEAESSNGSDSEESQEDNVTFVEKVELGVTYSHKNNNQVQVTFTKLPENPGSLTIEEIHLTKEQAEAFGLTDNIAYDITSDMEDGSFEYDLKLPIPEGTEEVSKVIYAENVTQLEDNNVGEVSVEQVEIVESDDSVVVSDLDHFTIFIVVPADTVSRTLIPFNPFIQGWSLEKLGNANIALVTAASAGVPNDFGPHIIKMDRLGGAGINRAFLGFYESGLKLSDIEDIKWNVYTKTGTDTYLNIYLRKNINETATIVVAPGTTPNVWQENSFADSTNITVRHNKIIGADITLNGLTFTDLMSSQYANWDMRVDVSARAGIAIVSGSTSPTDPQEHYVDGVILKIDGSEDVYNFADVNTAPVVTIESPTPAENSYVKGTITGRAIANDDRAMGSYYLRFWKDAFEVGNGGTLLNPGACQAAPGGEGLGDSVDASCVYDTKTNPDGTYVFSAQFLDSDNQWGSALRTFIVDNTKPIVVLNPVPSTNILNADNAEFTIDATDNMALKNIVGHIYQNGSLFDNNSKNVIGDGVTADSFTVDVSGLPDGDYTLRYNASDKAGNIAQTKTFDFTIDTTAPETPIHESPADDSYTRFNDFYFEWTDVVDAVEYEFQASQNPSVDGDGVLNVGVWNNKANGNSEQNFLTESRIHSVGANNTWYWQVRAIDEAGNKSAWTEPWTLHIDMVAPTVPEIITPTAEQVFNTTPILNEWTESTDASWITYQIAYAYDDEHTFGGSTCPTVTEIDGKAVSGCRDLTETSRNHTPGIDEQGGVTIWVRAIDSAANFSDWSEGVHYYYQVTPPAPKTETTETVTGDTSVGENQLGWLFNRDTSTATDFEFNTDQAVIGDGSLYVLPIGSNASDKFIGEYFPEVQVSDLTSFSFDFKLGDSAEVSDYNQVYLSVYANFGESDDDKFYDCRYNVLATTGSKDDFTTVTFDPTQTYGVTTRNTSPYACPAIPVDMDTLSPGSNIRALAINVGDTSVNDEGVDAYLDNAVIETDTEITTFDFEPVVEENNTETVTTTSSDRSRSGSRITPPTFTSGEVLGASTGTGSCQMYLNSYLKPGDANSEVSLLQTFLNDQGIPVPVTGYFGPLTRAAVIVFQNKYADEILKPWGVSATGFVFKTTRWKINNLVCEGSEDFPIIP